MNTTSQNTSTGSNTPAVETVAAEARRLGVSERTILRRRKAQREQELANSPQKIDEVAAHVLIAEAQETICLQSASIERLTRIVETLVDALPLFPRIESDTALAEGRDRDGN